MSFQSFYLSLSKFIACFLSDFQLIFKNCSTLALVDANKLYLLIIEHLIDMGSYLMQIMYSTILPTSSLLMSGLQLFRGKH